jgi:rod shape determining protein RodA
MGIFVAMLFASGLDLKPFYAFVGACVLAVPVGWHFLKDYQKDRLLVFMNPNIDPLGAGYTIIQSRIAIGSGRLFGKGWLAGTQNQLNFLPERHTDFIFSVIGEEWGVVGTLFVVGCYTGLIYCGLQIAARLKDRFGYLVTVGIVTILTLQVVINVSMTMGLSPVVGITLPFISYGRTSFVVFAIMMGFLLNLSRRRQL